MAHHYEESAAVYYSGKSLINLTVAKLVADEGCCLDVVSAGGLPRRLAGLPASRLHLHGNAKPNDELDYAIDRQVGAIVVDTLREPAVVGRASSPGS